MIYEFEKLTLAPWRVDPGAEGHGKMGSGRAVRGRRRGHIPGQQQDGEDARIWVCRGAELRGGGLELRITLII